MHTPTLSQGARLTAVKLKDRSGEEIGKVIEWLMDVEQGKVIYVVAKFNDADTYYAIPWALMKADLQKGGYFVDQDQVKEHNLQIDHDSVSDLVLDKEFLNRIYDSYQLAKYWEQNQTMPANPSSAINLDSAGSQADTNSTNTQESEGKGYGG
ncbi:PRC-barrel domain-containing protein [Rhodocytophaga aerolata]|uniref:PRC-barrel domain-containing protein n=1 Tax=Rhodocytophaga aerolata TaxID=455078 RepID=A0ABT8RJ66_9BACT|nr:PRC-barrel domain-containing protein [Rhodocytophaga aerolata]MDO1451449.1 PRC-barrel domain-containing protein [Rhodocytophaga aerolata]